MQLPQLLDELSKLADKATELDKIRGESIKPLFDKGLFLCLSKQLLPCVYETKNNVTALIKEQQKGKLDPDRATHLCERILYQFAALQRELGTLDVRSQESKYSSKLSKNIHQLYQDLSKHQDWERRLKAMIEDGETRLAQCQNFSEQQQMQKQLLTTESRLNRCIEARKKIETRIYHTERKG